MGIHWVYPLLKELIGGVKQLVAIQKGTNIFPIWFMTGSSIIQYIVAIHDISTDDTQVGWVGSLSKYACHYQGLYTIYIIWCWTDSCHKVWLVLVSLDVFLTKTSENIMYAGHYISSFLPNHCFFDLFCVFSKVEDIFFDQQKDLI